MDINLHNISNRKNRGMSKIKEYKVGLLLKLQITVTVHVVKLKDHLQGFSNSTSTVLDFCWSRSVIIQNRHTSVFHLKNKQVLSW